MNRFMTQRHETDRGQEEQRTLPRRATAEPGLPRQAGQYLIRCKQGTSVLLRQLLSAQWPLKSHCCEQLRLGFGGRASGVA
jgi:hypothetical protein